MKEHWKDEPEDHDFPAAAEYLSLIINAPRARFLVDALEKAPTRSYKAKDILRASGLPLLDKDNEHVKKDLDKVINGDKLSPVLLVRIEEQYRLVIADGYHRICASYHIDENTDVPCRLI